MQMKLSTTLRNIRDTLRAHEITDGQVIIRGEALASLVETLGFAADAAAALERDLEDTACRTVRSRPAGRIVPWPRSRVRRHQPQSRPVPSGSIQPGSDDSNGGDAA